MAAPGQPLDNDEVALAIQVLVENFHRPDKVAVADVRRNLHSTTRAREARGRQAARHATVTVKTSDQVVQSVKGPPEKAVAYVLMVGISADLIDEARRARDEANVAGVKVGADGRTEAGLVVPGLLPPRRGAN